jgi:tetratricopeptide (TPR) repeat protein
MLIKERLDITLRTLDSLQGLYDECIIAVDDDESQDELFEAIKIYPNTFVYRQKLPNGHFGNARQDVLNRIGSQATYIGWSDADEPLASPSPREIREYLYIENPAAVNVTLRYLYKAGPCYPGDYHRLRMWRANEPRQWRDAVHEWPAYIGNNDGSAVSKMDIVFNHLQNDLPLEVAKFRIDTMVRENSSDGWRYPRISGEYRGIGMYPEAIENAKLGLLSPRLDVQKTSMNELFFVCEEMGKKWENVRDALADLVQKHENIAISPLILEYLALAYYYLGDTKAALANHTRAKELDINKELQFIIDNDKYYEALL